MYVIKKITYSAFVIQLPDNLHISPILHVVSINLSKFVEIWDLGNAISSSYLRNRWRKFRSCLMLTR